MSTDVRIGRIARLARSSDRFDRVCVIELGAELLKEAWDHYRFSPCDECHTRPARDEPKLVRGCDACIEMFIEYDAVHEAHEVTRRRVSFRDLGWPW